MMFFGWNFSKPTELLLRFMQGENNPHSIYLLQEVLREEGQKTFQMFLFTELCILCSVGHDSPAGSVFLDEKKLGLNPTKKPLSEFAVQLQKGVMFDFAVDCILEKY